MLPVEVLKNGVTGQREVIEQGPPETERVALCVNMTETPSMTPVHYEGVGDVDVADLEPLSE